MSIFITFIALAGFFLVLQSSLKNLTGTKKRIATIGSSLLILISGIFIYSYPDIKNIQQNISFKVKSDSHFVTQIENTLSKNALIFQLPYVAFPDSPKIFHMTDYDLLRGYLYSHHLHWSYGAMKGRDISNNLLELSQLPPPLLLKQLIILGFEGLYINKNGYPDHAENFEKELTTILGTPPITSEYNDLIFYNLNDYKSKQIKV